MVPTQFSRLQAFEAQVLNLLHRECAINPTSIPKIVNDNQTKWTIPSILSAIATSLESNHKGAEATALTDVVERITAEKNFGGLGIPLNPDFPVSEADYVDAAFIVDAMLLSLNAELSSRKYLPVFPSPSDAAGPMTLAQKIFAQHLVGTNPTAGQLRAGTVIRVGLDWVLSSELSWQVRVRLEAHQRLFCTSLERLQSDVLYHWDRQWPESTKAISAHRGSGATTASGLQPITLFILTQRRRLRCAT